MGKIGRGKSKNLERRHILHILLRDSLVKSLVSQMETLA